MQLNHFGERIKDILPLLKGSVLFLLKHMINGNFAVFAGVQRNDLVHFCHGAPGFISFLCEAYKYYKDVAFKIAA